MMSRWSAATFAFAMIVAGIAAAAPAVTGPSAPTFVMKPASTGTAPPAEPLEPHALTAQDADVFFDGLMPYALARGDIAGSVLVIVKDGQILFSKGYGYSDVAKRRPVSVDETLFRIGSVSKTFTWTSVMQLVQAGKLDLDRDVNDYLDFKIPEKFGKPITIRNLMTHTPGFEEGISDAFVKNANQLYPLGDYLKKHIPARIYPPGKVVSYSNYGASLAGYIVQRVSGEPFADYVANYIFKPLGMQHSTFVQPLPPALAPDMSEGYLQASDKKPFPFEFVETAPAGAVSATGADMAHFMIAHLENGSYDGASILSPSTIALMHSPQSRMAPGVNGFDLGFYQENRNGLRIIGHAGDTSAFHSDLHLLLDKDIGVFMSFNSLGKEGESDKFRMTLFRTFLDRYFPYQAADEKTVADPKPDAARVAGWYAASRRIVSGLRLLSALDQSKVAANPDGTITIDVLKDVGGNLKTWREVGPLTYREVGGQTHTKFVTGKDGHIRYWISDDFLPVELFLREGGLTQQGVAMYLLGGLIAVLSLSLVVWIGGWLLRRHYDRSLELPAPGLRLAARLGAIVILTMFGGWALLFAEIGKGIWTLNGPLTALYLLGVLALISALAILVEAALRVLRGPGGLLVRAGELVLGLSALYAIWAIYIYGLANFSFTY